jgi:hypothetical protein
MVELRSAKTSFVESVPEKSLSADFRVKREKFVPMHIPPGIKVSA